MTLATIWLIIAIFLFILELLTPGFVVACFGVGALCAAIGGWLGGGIGWQVALFAVGSIASLLFLKPFLNRVVSRRDGNLKTGVDALIGREARVISPINGRDTRGYIAIDGDKWPALAKNPSDSFTEGEQVVIIAYESITMYVARPSTTPPEA